MDHNNVGEYTSFFWLEILSGLVKAPCRFSPLCKIRSETMTAMNYQKQFCAHAGDEAVPSTKIRNLYSLSSLQPRILYIP